MIYDFDLISVLFGAVVGICVASAIRSCLHANWLLEEKNARMEADLRRKYG